MSSSLRRKFNRKSIYLNEMRLNDSAFVHKEIIKLVKVYSAQIFNYIAFAVTLVNFFTVCTNI